MKKIEIKIEGPAGSGKTTLAYVIKAVLDELDFTADINDDASMKEMGLLPTEELHALLEKRLEYIPRECHVVITTQRK